MNNINLIGRISNDLELRTTGTGKSVLNFNLAVNRPVNYEDAQQTDFIPIQVWGKLAENLNKYQKKGSQIAVEGSLRIDNYSDTEGNKKYKTYVTAYNIEFLGTKQEEQEEVEQEIVEQNGVESIKQEEITLTDDDLPF